MTSNLRKHIVIAIPICINLFEATSKFEAKIRTSRRRFHFYRYIQTNACSDEYALLRNDLEFT